MTKQDKVAKVMHEWKNGRLTSNGKKVTDYDQAIAIALSEAGLSKKMKKDGNMNKYAKGGSIDAPKIYVADLEAYNNGKLVGEWLDLSDFEDGKDVSREISKLLKKWGAEEYAIHDVENVPSSIYSEYMGEEDFDKIIKIYKASEENDLPYEVISEIILQYEPEDLEEWISDHYEGHFDNDTDLAYGVLENMGGVSDLGEKTAEMYFDYDAFGRDLEINDDWEGDFDSNEDRAYDYVENMGGVSELGNKTIDMYFDYEKFGRDLAINDYIEIEDGYYFRTPTYSKGGNIIERRYVNKDEDYEVRYAKNRPMRKGYNDERMFAEGGAIESEINELYKKSKFINDDFNWKTKLLEMLQDQSIEAYQIYQSLNEEEKEAVLQELYEMDNDMGSYGDEDMEMSKENLSILLEDSKNGKKYAKGGMVVTKIKDIPNFKERLDEGRITYRGLGMGKLSDDFYKLSGTNGTRIKVDGKEYFITDEEFDTFSRDESGKLRVRFNAPNRKFAVGGEIGNTVSFKGDYGTPRSGVVKEKRGSSYIVATDDGDRLVDSYEVISFSETPVAKKKRFGFFAEGGEMEEYKRGGFIYEVQKKGSPSNDMRETMFTAKNLTELKKKIIEKYGTSEGFLVSRRTDKGYYASVKFAEGGEIQSKIDKLQSVVSSKMLPESVKETARKKIAELEKELHESKETKAEEKEEHKAGGKEARLDKKEELNATIQKLYGIEGKAEDLINYQSGGIQGQSVDKIKKYVEYVNKEVSKLDVPFGSEVFEVLEDENAHSLNLTLGLLGFYKNKKDSGEWAKQHEQYAKVIDVVNEVKGGGKATATTKKEISKVDEIREKVISFLNPLGYYATVTDNKTEIYIEPSTRHVGKNRADFFNGMQIIYDVKDKEYEVSEYQAGNNEDELHIYKVTPSLTLALKDLIKGNKRKPIKIWGDDKNETTKPTTKKAPVKKAVAKKVVVKKEVKGDLPKSKFEKGDKVGVSGDNEVYEIKDKSYRNNIEGELTWVYYLPEYSSVLVSEKNLKVVPKPKADHKKLVAKLKAKKGATPSNKASLVPFTDKRRKRNESSDRKRDALPLGKRVSEDGNIYYENRLNRADMNKQDKFKEGGSVGDEKLYYVVAKKKGQLVDVTELPMTKEDCNRFIKDQGIERTYDYNSVDVIPYHGNKPRFKYEKGGEIKNSGWGLNLNW